MREENSGLEGHRFTSYNDLPDRRKIQTGDVFKGARFGQVGTGCRRFGRQAASSSNVRRIPGPRAHICLTPHRQSALSLRCCHIVVFARHCSFFPLLRVECAGAGAGELVRIGACAVHRAQPF